MSMMCSSLREGGWFCRLQTLRPGDLANGQSVCGCARWEGLRDVTRYRQNKSLLKFRNLSKDDGRNTRLWIYLEGYISAALASTSCTVAKKWLPVSQKKLEHCVGTLLPCQ